jgi:ribosome biogenesis protein UTP30
MAKDELIDDRVSLAQCKKAVEALHKHASEKQAEKEQNELLPGKEQNIWLNVTVKKIHAERKFKPAKMYVCYYWQQAPS